MRVAKYHIGPVLFLFLCLVDLIPVIAQTPILNRRISISVQQVRMSQALEEIGRKGDFFFSYNSEIIPIDSIVNVKSQHEKVQRILNKMMPDGIKYKQSGRHLILIRKMKRKEEGSLPEKVIINGYIVNAQTQEKIVNASVHEVGKLNTAISDSLGKYELLVSGKTDYLGITFSKASYLDTVIFIRPSDTTASIDIYLRPSLARVDPLPVNIAGDSISKDLDELSFVRFWVPEYQLKQAENLEINETRLAQVSLIPGVGTNRNVSGLVTNNLSLNVLAGYSGGLSGVEIGGLTNIVRNDVRGLQIGGLGNVTGGNANGVQIGGLFNNVRGSVKGVQIAGLSNVILDTLTGVQITAFSNVLRGSMRGVQIAGFNNLTTQNVAGFQIAGFSNITLKDVNVFQISGFFNLGRNVNGFQATGFVNVATGDVGGVQIAGLANYARNVKAAQISAFANIAAEEIGGLQLCTFINYGTTVKGSQIGLFNFSDTISGITLGFLSFALKGYHKAELYTNEVMYGNLALKTGSHKLHNIFAGGLGWNDAKQEIMWSVGYGFGSHFNLSEKMVFNLDATVNQIVEQQKWVNSFNLLSRLQMNAGYQFGKAFGIFAGASLNIHYSEWKDPDTQEFLTSIAPKTFYESSNATSKLQMWLGWQVGFRF